MPYCVGFNAREIVATTGRLVQEACHTRSYTTAIVNKKIETAGFELISTAMYAHRSDTPGFADGTDFNCLAPELSLVGSLTQRATGRFSNALDKAVTSRRRNVSSDDRTEQ